MNKGRILVALMTFSIVLTFFSQFGLAWWNNSWVYRKPIQINSSTALTDYQVLINVTYDANMLNDFDDIRFVNGSDTTELDYWIQRKVDGSFADVWIKVDSIKTTNGTQAYLYYGNGAAASGSNITTTMEWGDDFNRADSATVGNGWVETEGGTTTASIEGNRLKINDNDAGNAVSIENVNATTDNNLIYEYLIEISQTTGYMDLDLRDGSDRSTTMRFDNSANIYYVDGSGAQDSGFNYVADKNYSIKVVTFKGNHTVDFFNRSTTFGAGYTWRDSSPDVIDRFYTTTSSAQTGVWFFSWVFRRKYTLDEPENSVGAEEKNKFEILTETYNTSGRELTTHIFSLDVDGIEGTDMNATFTWNNTDYVNPSKTNVSNNFTFSRSITMPSVDGLESVNFNWTYTINGSTTNTPTRTFTIYNINITNCTYGATDEFITFFLLDEETENPLENGTAQLELTGGLFGNWSLTYPDIDNNFSICVSPAGASFQYDIDVMTYTVENYDTRSYFLDDYTLNNVTDNIDLYLLNESSSTSVTFEVINKNGDPLASHTLRIRKYMGNATYPVVAMCETNDVGECTEDIDIPNWYKFTVLDGSTVLTLQNSDKVEITGTEHTVIVDEGGYGEYWGIFGNVVYNCTTNTTGNYTLCEWADSTGSFTESCLNISIQNWENTTSISSSCDASSSDSLSYIYNTSITNIYTWVWYINHDGEIYIIESGIFSVESITQQYADYGLFAAFLIIITIGMIGLVGTRTASGGVFGLGLGFVFSALLNLIPIAVVYIVGIMGLMLILGYLVS